MDAFRTVLIVICRAFLIVSWLLSPAMLLVLYLWGRRRTMHGWSIWNWLNPASVAINWIIFAILLIRSRTPYGMIFLTSILTDLLLAMACLGVALGVKNRRLLLANSALITLWIVTAYAPAHWMSSSGPGDVRINGQPVAATIYFGYPTDSEAEAVALIDVPGAGDYFLSFGTEKARIAATRGFVHMPGGVWVFKSLRDMKFAVEPLPSDKVNQLRVESPDGRLVEVQF